MPENSALKRLRQEGFYEFKINLGYVLIVRPAWVTKCSPVSKTQK